jgi:LCP family protein required for cell wall assembly
MTAEPRADSEAFAATRGEGRRQKAVFIAAILLLAAGAMYAALAVAVRVDAIFFPGNSVTLPGPLARVPGLDSKPADGSPITDRINILILGLDRRPHHTISPENPGRADSIHVLSVDPVTKTGGVLAIPRDLYVEMPNPQGRSGTWQTRINTAYQNGAYYKYPGGGPALARDTVEGLLKIKINYYMVVDWTAFAEIIDALGGIDVTVPTALRRVEAVNARDGNSWTIDIPAGRQHMDSITALAYSRYRGDALGDIARIQRQQQVMLASMEKALTLGWLSSAPSLWTKYRGAVDTDISTARLPGLVALARQVGPERLVLASLAGENGEAVRSVITSAGEDVLVPIWDKAVPLVQSVIYDRRLRAEGAQVRIVAPPASRGQAARVASILARAGFAPADIVVGDAEPGERRTDTAVIDHTGKEYTSRRIVEALGLKGSVVQRPNAAGRGPGDADVVIAIGPDLRLPAETSAAWTDGR